MPPADERFTGNHRERFKELLGLGEVNAINLQPEHLPFGPWVLGCDLQDPHTGDRLKARFRAAARRAAISAGAPPRVGLLDWWISGMVRHRQPYIQNLLQRSIELCEEIESSSAVSAVPLRRSDTTDGLRREDYETGLHLPFALYDVPHDRLLDPKAEFDYWEERSWQNFRGLLKTPDGVVIADRVADKRLPGETRLRFRNRVHNRVLRRYELIESVIENLGLDLAVLLANYVIDRRLVDSRAQSAYAAESGPLVEKIEAFWVETSRRLGLSCRKPPKGGLEPIDFAKPFSRVSPDLARLVARAPNAFISAVGAEPGQAEANDRIMSPQQSGKSPGEEICPQAPLYSANRSDGPLGATRSEPTEDVASAGVLSPESNSEDKGDSGTGAPPSRGSARVFRRAGDIWIISFAGKTVHIRHSKGMVYICQLLQSAGQSLHSFQLLTAAAGQSGTIRPGSAGEVLDEKALRQYRDRMDDIEMQLSEAERNCDQAQKERLMTEKERFEDEIQSAVGLGGGLREAHDDTEKARKSVSNAISRAIASIREYHPTAADHLQMRINCGVFIDYAPDESAWEF
jgi:hypothetical protein